MIIQPRPAPGPVSAPPGGSRSDGPRPAARGLAARAGTITDIVFGVIWYRMLATRQPLDDKLATELVSALTGPPPGQDPLTISRRKRT